MLEGSIDNLYFSKARSAFFGCDVEIKTSDYQVKLKRMEGTFLSEISVNFIVIGQRH